MTSSSINFEVAHSLTSKQRCPYRLSFDLLVAPKVRRGIREPLYCEEDEKNRQAYGEVFYIPCICSIFSLGAIRRPDIVGSKVN